MMYDDTREGRMRWRLQNAIAEEAQMREDINELVHCARHCNMERQKRPARSWKRNVVSPARECACNTCWHC